MQSKSKSQPIPWYSNAVFYGVLVKIFKDGDGDGHGDFKGLTEELDYIQDLGVNCIWLLPFYPSANRDDGYDIINHCAIEPGYGTEKDFRTLIKEAKKRGIRIIIDLVLHHTSDYHPWFLKARQNHPKYKDYYVWAKKIPKESPQKNAFPIIEPGRWKFDQEKREFFYHCFYRFEPDLNIANPEVQKEIKKIMDYWLSFGIDGFRMDAAYLMFEKKDIPGTEIADPARLMEEWNAYIKKKNKDAVILAEADTPLDGVDLFFGQGGRMDLMFNFLLNRYIFLSFAEKDAKPMREMLEKIPKPPPGAQWLNFLRNHDELNLDLLTGSEQKKVFKAFAPEAEMKIYGRGIRRRLAPMFEGDLRRLKMAYSLLFSLPGSAMVLYGDEIGLGDNLELVERTSVRIPMQWKNELNAGFSTVHPGALINATIQEGPFGYEKVNVQTQLKDDASLLSHIKTLSMIKKSYDEIGAGEYEILPVVPDSVFAISYLLEGRRVLMLTNLSDRPCKVQMKHYQNETFREILKDGMYDDTENGDNLALHGYGYRWFTVIR